MERRTLKNAKPADTKMDEETIPKKRITDETETENGREKLDRDLHKATPDLQESRAREIYIKPHQTSMKAEPERST